MAAYRCPFAGQERSHIIMDCANISNKIFEQLKKIGYGVLCCENNDELTIKYASDSFYDILGYKEGEITALLNNSPNTVLRNDKDPIDWKEIKSKITKDGFAMPELRLIKKDGHHIWAQYRVCLTEKDGKEYFWGIISDITLKRRSNMAAREQAQELKALSDNIPGGVLRFRDDVTLTFEFISEGFCRITGYTREEIKNKFNDSLLNMVYEDDRELLIKQIRGQRGENETSEITYRINIKNGGCIWVINKYRHITDCNGNVWLYSVLIDITDTKKAQDELSESEERYRLILEYASDPVLDIDLKNNRFYYSSVFYTKFGKNHACTGNLLEELEKTGFIYPGDKNCLKKSIENVRQNKKTGDIECRFKDISGKYIWCNVHHTVFFNSQGTLVRIIALISDIDKRKKETQILRSKAEHDLLTGLYNRITTTSLIENILRGSTVKSRHAMFVIDIDNFKSVNDTLGHLCGDRLIVETAMLLKKQFREDDIVGRIGGDEFVVFIKNIKSDDFIVNKAKHICERLHLISKKSAQSCDISCSIGISIYPRDGDNYEEIFQKADSAMYEAKRGGKDNYCVYSEIRNKA